MGSAGLDAAALRQDHTRVLDINSAATIRCGAIHHDAPFCYLPLVLNVKPATVASNATVNDARTTHYEA